MLRTVDDQQKVDTRRVDTSAKQSDRVDEQSSGCLAVTWNDYLICHISINENYENDWSAEVVK